MQSRSVCIVSTIRWVETVVEPVADAVKLLELLITVASIVIVTVLIEMLAPAEATVGILRVMDLRDAIELLGISIELDVGLRLWHFEVSAILYPGVVLARRIWLVESFELFNVVK